MKTKFGVVAAITIGLSVFASYSFAGGEDIYPGGFVEDCEYSSVEGDFSARLLDFTGNQVDKQKAGKEFSVMCNCLSDKFFSREFSDVPYAYETYISYIQYNGHINAQARVKNMAGRDINQCKIEASKARAAEGIKKFDSEQKSAPKGDLKSEFMADIRKSLGANVNEGYLRKADYLAKCFADRVGEYKKTNPELVPRIVERIHQNLRAGTFVQVKVNDDTRMAELAVLNIDGQCW